MKKLSSALALTVLLAANLGPAPSFAQVEPAQSLSFDAAWRQLQGSSDRLAASRAASDSKRLLREGLQGLGGPFLALNGAALAYNANLNINLDPLSQTLSQIGQHLPIALPALQLPSNYTYNRQDTGASAWLTAVWPVYSGGAADATRGFASAQAAEMTADEERTRHELATQLAQRYFGAQLAGKAANLREAARENVAQHDRTADRLLAAGVISRVERLQAQAALEDARRNAFKARDDAELAAVALARTLKAAGVVIPLTPLFVLVAPVEPLDHFTQAALQHHPGLAKVDARKTQAEQLHEGQEALRRPQVFAYGLRQLKSGNADWIAGVGFNWMLLDAIDRNAMASSSLKSIEQAQRTDSQARSDIALLVERNWRALEQTRRQFFGLQPGTEVAQEMLHLRTAGLREGTSTALDLIDAETQLAKVQTERAQVAFDYVMALANLLEASGLSEELGAYAARANVRVE